MGKLTAAALLAAALAVSPAALASNRDSKAGAPDRSADKNAEKTAERKSADDRGSAKDQPEDNLESCKRDADGMKGPERSRFMTECLKERR